MYAFSILIMHLPCSVALTSQFEVQPEKLVRVSFPFFIISQIEYLFLL